MWQKGNHGRRARINRGGREREDEGTQTNAQIVEEHEPLTKNVIHCCLFLPRVGSGTSRLIKTLTVTLHYITIEAVARRCVYKTRM